MGHPVRGFATREERLSQIRAAGATATQLDLDAPIAPLDLAGEMVFYMAPPEPTGKRDERLERLLAHATGRPRRFVYLSTTGVYGDRQGGHVDEDTPPAPRTERAIRRLAAEQAVRAWAEAHDVSWCILRVAGIYGPGRLPIGRLRRQEPAIEPDEATPTNRIHIDDLAAAAVAAGLREQAGRRIYNVTDGSEDSLTAYLQRVARVLGLAPPPLISRAEALERFSARTWSFLGESRRVDNRRMLEELGVTLAYSDLDAGIRASMEPI